MAVISIGSDFWDYSRYDSSCSVVNIYGAVEITHQGQPCTITLARDDVYGVVATHVLPNVGATFLTSFDLNSSEMQDTDGFNRVIQSNYTITAALGSGETATLAITVSLVSVRQIREQWMYGITALSSEVVLPRQQPRTMPVQVKFVSPAFVKDAYDLVFTTGSTPTLGFANGPAKPVIPNTGLQDYVLLDEHESDYVQVRVNTFLLPASNTVETLVIDQAQLTDLDIIQQIRLATSYIETRMGWFLEPHLVVSEHLKAQYPKYEYLRDGASFYNDFNPYKGTFPNISLPLQQLLKVKELTGFYNKQKVLTLPQAWIQEGARMDGNIELVPTPGQASALVWQTFPFAFSIMQTRLVPAFWQYAVLSGLVDLHDEREVLREAIAKKCVIESALFAANAYKAGVTAESTSRDNISVSRSFSTSAMYSVYAHITLPYIDWLKENLPQIRKKFGGILVVTPE